MDKEQKLIIDGGQRIILPYQGKWLEFRRYRGELFLVEDEFIKDKVPKSVVPEFEKLFVEYENNPLAKFLPHGGQLGLLNDWDNGWCFLLSPNQVGKSKSASAWVALRLVPCNPEWDIFKYNGVKYHEWKGAKKFIAASYSWDNVATLYSRYIETLPREELGCYAPNWGKYDGETGSPKDLSFGDGRAKNLPLKCGSVIRFLCYGQSQKHWEGFDADGAQLDEQCPRPKAVGLIRSFTTRGVDCQIACSLTGHVLDDRPDTGASGWMKTELWDAEGVVMGKTVGRYKIKIDDVPDAIISKKMKRELYVRWVEEPRKNKDEATLREAEARYWGGWESGSGLVLYNFNPSLHKIPKIDMNNMIVRETTRYRGIDHGLSRPCAGAWVMVFPWGDVLMYREYFMKHGIVPKHAENIVKLSGNKRKNNGVYYDRMSKGSFERLKEEFTGERYKASVLDSRSFASPGQETTRTIGEQYNQYGLNCRPSKGWRNEKIVPQMLALLEPDHEKPHLMYELHKRGIVSNEVYEVWLKERGGNWKGGCRLYFTCDLDFTFKEAVRWANNPKTGLPESAHDHIVGGALKYIIAENPKFWGDPSKKYYNVNTLREVDDEERKEESPYKYVRY